MLICEVLNLNNPYPSEQNNHGLFVVVKCNDKIYRTKTVWRDVNPIWNNAFIFNDKISYDDVEITFTLYDDVLPEVKLREDTIRTKNGIFFGECCEIMVKCYSIEIMQLGEKDRLIENVKYLKDELQITKKENNKLTEEVSDLKERAAYIKRELEFFVNSLK